MTTLGTVTPVLRSFDAARTRAFYLDFLGFELVFEHRFEPGMPLYMGVRSGDCVLHLSEHYGDGAPGASVRIACVDVRAYAATLRASGFDNARAAVPEPTPWGTLEFGVHDPSHNRLTFFTPVAGADDE
jgi:catechol 2,3-dioxygenase-like lactoylglutathione lyase family enzyme